MSSELPVNFHPALFLQRRVWILDILRREAVTEILDIGCGEGQLLTVLCQPAPWLQPPPVEAYNRLGLSGGSPASEIHAKDEFINLHPKRVLGLDISLVDLEFAVKNTTPYLADAQEMRWEPLETCIWRGGLEVFNPEFVDVECIVSTEVIEHLPESVLRDFAPMILGAYHPKLFLLTTPSYTFNERFTRPGDESARNGFPDPTKRTDRVYRHDDHQFEWTVNEFEKWCREAAELWGYDVYTSSVGRAIEVDEWGRDEELGGASLVAEFRRKDEASLRLTRKDKSSFLVKAAEERQRHERLATHQHVAHPLSRQPETLENIGAAIKSSMEGFREAFMRIEEVWFQTHIAVLCGGWMEFLILAVENHDKLTLQTIDTQKRSTWQVELVDGVEVRSDLWPSADPDGSLDFIPHGWSPDEDSISTASEWDNGSTAAGDGDVSWSESGVEGSTSAGWESDVSSSWAQSAPAWSSVAGEDESTDSVNIPDETGSNPWSDEEINLTPSVVQISDDSASGWEADGDQSTKTN